MPKRIADPVHKTIPLTELELAIIDSPCFQRLRHVKQLGLSHLVFPGANYSRFSHSLGVCHITGRIFDSLRTDLLENHGINDEDYKNLLQKYRLAGLLHDVGHYPFSHTMEQALKIYFDKQKYRDGNSIDTDGSTRGNLFEHEQVGKFILEHDETIRRILDDAQLTPNEISDIFTREAPLEISNIVSSDLDADRLDYLLRTATHTGLPYGTHDLEYIVSQLKVFLDDKQRKNVCVSEKALRAVDHFLLSRYFDYMQINFHKTVVGMELILKDVLNILIEEELLKCSEDDIKEQISEKKWINFDDIYVENLIREYYEKEAKKDFLREQKLRSVMRRIPPKLVYSFEAFGDGAGYSRLFETRQSYIKQRMPEWAERFVLDKDLWYVWPQKRQLTAISALVPIAPAHDEEENEAYDKLAYVEIPKNSGKGVPIVGCDRSLMKVLSNYYLYTIRIYVICNDQDKQRAIFEFFENEDVLK